MICAALAALCVAASWNASCTYSVSANSTSGTIFNSFLDGSAAQTLTIYIYCASDRSNAGAVFCPKTVNGTNPRKRVLP